MKTFVFKLSYAEPLTILLKKKNYFFRPTPRAAPVRWGSGALHRNTIRVKKENDQVKC